MTKKAKTITLVIVLFVAVFVFVFIPILRSFLRFSDKTSKVSDFSFQINVVTESLEDFYRENGHYPADLSEVGYETYLSFEVEKFSSDGDCYELKLSKYIHNKKYSHYIKRCKDGIVEQRHFVNDQPSRWP